MSTTCLVPLAAPEIDEATVAHVAEVLRGSTLSIGPRLEAFERAFAKSMGTSHAVGVNSGTSGLHLAVRCLDLGPGDEVITTPFSFIASANCLLFEEVTPVFVDIDPDTFVVDLDQVEVAIGKRTRGLLPVHVFGYPVDMNRCMDLASRHGLAVIEDACEAVGGCFNDRKLGSWGDMGVFGFYPNKQMTTGEGGMVVTSRDDLPPRLVSLRNQGRCPSGDGSFHELGYNYRMSEVTAAIGERQIEQLPDFIERRRALEKNYHELLGDLEEIRLLPTREDRSPFVFVIVTCAPSLRESLRAHLGERGIQNAVYFRAIHLERFYRERFSFREGQFPRTEAAAATCLALPFFTTMTPSQQELVANEVREGVARWRLSGQISSKQAGHSMLDTLS